jgi:GNAT superfamily N-acetyltransferase
METMEPESHGEMNARRCSASDLDLVTEIVTLAFEDDPLWSRALARSDGDTSHFNQFWRPLVEGALRHPWVWITTADEATAVWLPPDASEMTDEQQGRLVELAHQYLGSGADDYLKLGERFEAARPKNEPHYYLTLLATHPAHRGRGVGMSLLAQNLAQIDAEGRPAYLESSNPANNSRYARLGFAPIGEFSFPGGGPKVTTMWREARPN